ncbi:hypothetical protein BRD01_14055 [Halobacteriales archaeon QS_8_65_32]|nr:MAG: hypothetical protein BRD01_14055 [Halobacteriales archaeon QS_8_65_32]
MIEVETIDEAIRATAESAGVDVDDLRERADAIEFIDTGTDGDDGDDGDEAVSDLSATSDD